MRTRLTLLFLLCLVPAVALPAADVEVGRILSAGGPVTVDAFGKGAFIAARAGDRLYQASVVRAGPEGRAVISLQGTERHVAPGATVRIADLLVSVSRARGTGWLAAVGSLFRSISESIRAAGTPDEVVLAGRAADATQRDSGIEWETGEPDPDELFEEATADAAAADYVGALALLQSIPPDSPGVSSWDVAFWEGYCYFQLEDYASAATLHGRSWTAAAAARVKPGTPVRRRILQFQLAASRCMLGQEKAALPLLEDLVAAGARDEYQPFSLLFLARALAATGNPTRARTVAEQGLRDYAGSAREEDFSALLAELSGSR